MNVELSAPLRPVDVEFYERELASFVPPRVFDAHCHLHHSNHYEVNVAGVPRDVGYAEYRRFVDMLHPGREVSALFLPMPSRRDVMDLASAWISRAVNRPDAREAGCRGLFFVRPEDDPEWVRQEVRRLGLSGLKCYHTMSATKPTWDADIEAYLPEKFLRPAHEEGWVITLHMVKARAVADPANIACIRRYCEKYPNMKLILAHSARGFQPAHNLEGLPHLRGLDNLYFDTSANCEPIAHEAILRIIGHDKLMYGSDFFISHMRGRSLSAADSFLWLYEDKPVWGEKHQRVEPVLVGLEHLRSVKWACWSAQLSDAQVEDVFWGNAKRLLG